MLYLITNRTRHSGNFFFADTSTGVASSVWSSTIPSAVRDFSVRTAPSNHSVFKWISSGCPLHSTYKLAAIFESSDLSQDFEAGISHFRETHPEYFV